MAPYLNELKHVKARDSLIRLTTVLSHWDFSHGKCGLLSPGKPAATESRYPTYGTCWVCFGVSIIHRTLSWTTGSFTRAHVLMYAIAHGSVRTPEESLQCKMTGREILCCAGESNLQQRRAGPTLYQLSYIPQDLEILSIPHGLDFLLQS